MAQQVLEARLAQPEQQELKVTQVTRVLMVLRDQVAQQVQQVIREQSVVLVMQALME